MTLDPFPRTQRTQRQGRFQDVERGQGLLSGFRGKDPIDKKFLRRQLKPFFKYGVPKKFSKLKGMSDTELEKMAAKAIIKSKLKSGEIKRKKLPTRVNRKRFTRRQLKHARGVMRRVQAGTPVKKRALRRTKAARQHIRKIRANRKIMSKPLFL